MEENEYSFQDKLKMYENLLRSYQEELEKKTNESMRLKVDLDLLNTKYTSLLNKNSNDKNTSFNKTLKTELEQKDIYLENMKSTLSSLKENLRKSEKKNSLLKFEIDKKETFIKELLYEKKQVEMDLEEKILELNEISKNQQKFTVHKQTNNDKSENLSRELDLSKDINKTLITLLKWKNIEVEQLKNSKTQNSTIISLSEEDLDEKITKFKGQEKVLLNRLAEQMKNFAKISDSSLE